MKRPPLILVLLGLSLLTCGACARTDPARVADETAPPPPPPAPSAPPRVAAGNAPYRVLKIQHYWAFKPDIVYYHQRGRMQALVDNPPAIEVAWEPCYPQARPRNVTSSANVKVLDLRDHPGANTPLAVGVVIGPVHPLRAGETLAYDISYDQARVPYLHDEDGSSHRLLSLTIANGNETLPNQYVYAIPSNCTQVTTSDLRPFKREERDGWTVFAYDSGAMQRITMHLGFTFSSPPSQPPPSAESVFSSLP